MKLNPTHTLIALLAAFGVSASGFVGAQESKPAADAAKAAAPTAPSSASPAQPPSPVEVTKVSTGKVFEEVSATGTVKAAESVMLRPDIIGRIAKLNFKDGDKVRKGQILVELDVSLQQANKDQAKAELDLAISNYKRNEDLANKKFISGSILDQAESQVKVAQAKLALAEAQMQRGLIRAPFDGSVGLRNVSVGEYVRDGADIVTVDDLSRLRVDFKLPERYAAQAKMGMKVMVEPDPSLKLKGLGGKVDSIDTVLDTNGRALTLRVRIPNPKGLLKPGMFVKTKLILSEREGALLVPDEAVQAQGREMLVYKVIDGKAVRTTVKTGARQMGKIEIMDGLKEGDIIIQTGLQRINRDGQAVRVVEPRGGQGAGAKPADGKPLDGKPLGGKTSAAKSVEGKPSEGKPTEGKPANQGKPDGERRGKKPE